MKRERPRSTVLPSTEVSDRDSSHRPFDALGRHRVEHDGVAAGVPRRAGRGRRGVGRRAARHHAAADLPDDGHGQQPRPRLVHRQPALARPRDPAPHAGPGVGRRLHVPLRLAALARRRAAVAARRRPRRDPAPRDRCGGRHRHDLLGDPGRATGLVGGGGPAEPRPPHLGAARAAAVPVGRRAVPGRDRRVASRAPGCGDGAARPVADRPPGRDGPGWPWPGSSPSCSRSRPSS